MSCDTLPQTAANRPPRRLFHWLYITGFANCFATSAWWTAIPFVVSAMGGSPNHVGCAMGIYTIVYMVCCLAGSLVLSGKNPKTLVQIGLIGSAVVPAALATLVLVQNHFTVRQTIAVVYAISVLFGLVQSLAWPFLFSWQSSGFSGAALGTPDGALHVCRQLRSGHQPPAYRKAAGISCDDTIGHRHGDVCTGTGGRTHHAGALCN